MASGSSVRVGSRNNHKMFSPHFPAVINGEINIAQFLKAALELVRLVERLGTVFAPVKYDMNGNIEKISKNYVYDENSCLVELMKEEIKKGSNTTIEGVLWLNRAILFFELIFGEIIKCLQSNNYDVSMKNMLTVGYEGSVKKYHGWVTQQLFTLICKMSPTLPQVFKSLGVNDNLKEFEQNLSNYNAALHAVRSRIDKFFHENNLFVE